MKLKRALFFVIYIFTIAVTVILWSCGNSTQLSSIDYDDALERVKVLKKQIVYASDFTDAEFALFNVNGFSNDNARGIPGTSSWNYAFVVKADTADLNKWIAGMTRIDSIGYDKSWMEEITKIRSANWITKSEPEVYRRGEENLVVILYRKEGFIFKRVVNT